MSNTKKSGVRPTVDCSKDKGKTEQQHKKQVSTQHIVDKHRATGLATHIANEAPQYGDQALAPDYFTAQRIIANAKSLFETVPAHIRKHCENDAGKFLEFIQSEENREKMEEFGMDTSHLPEPVAPETPPAAPAAPETPPEEA